MNLLYVSMLSEMGKSRGQTHVMPSAHSLAIGFIGLNSNLACWKLSNEASSNGRARAEPPCKRTHPSRMANDPRL